MKNVSPRGAKPEFELSLRKVVWMLGIVIALVWARSLVGSYHFDDSHSVESNIAIRSLYNIPSFWTDPRTSSFIPENRVYRPLVYTFYSFCYLMGQGATWPFHLMKIAMHLSVCLALFVIWRQLWSQPGWFPVRSLHLTFPKVSRTFILTPEWSAFFLALVFAVHPSCSECVAYISATTSLQCAMFYLWSYCFYLRSRDGGDHGLRWLGLSLLFYFLSVASKEEGITLPAMIVVTELFLLPGGGLERLKPALNRSLPFWAVGVLLSLWIFWMHPESGNESRGWVSWEAYFMTQWRAYLWYMRLWFWPFDLNADYATVQFSRSLLESRVILAAIGNGVIIAFAWFNRRRFPAMLFAISWFYITISPASSVIRLAEAINEHRMYLAFIGFVGGTFTVLLYCADSYWPASGRRSRALGWIYMLIVLSLAIGSQERNRVWANDENLWLDTVEKNPTSGRALNNLALVYLNRDEFEKSITYLERCQTYWPSYVYCALNKAISLHSLGKALEAGGKQVEAQEKFDRAEKSFLRAYQLNPRHVHLNFHLGKFYSVTRGDCEKGMSFLRASVVGTGGRYPAAEAQLASCLAKLNRHKEALEAITHALEVEPGSEILWFEKAKIQYEARDYDGSSQSYQSILSSNPNSAQAWYNLGISWVALARHGDARKAFERVISLDSHNEQAWSNLVFVLEKQGDGAGALEAMRKLLDMQPGRTEFQLRLRALQRKFGG